MAQFIVSIAPYSLLLVCPLMMVFMMKGMHGHKEEDSQHKQTQMEIEQLKAQNQQLVQDLAELKRQKQN